MSGLKFSFSSRSTSRTQENERSSSTEPSLATSPVYQSSQSSTSKDTFGGGKSHGVIPRVASPSATSATGGLRPNAPAASASVSVRAGGAPGSGRGTLSQAQIDAHRGAKKNAKKTKQEVNANKPLSGAQSEAAYTQHIKEHANQVDLAERTLARLPNDEKKSIADGKIYKYGFNETGTDSAPKAKALAAIGYHIAPGGFDKPYSESVEAQGEHLRRELMEGTSKASVVLKNVPEEKIRENGIYYTTTVDVSGVGAKRSESRPAEVGWIDKRRPDGAIKGAPELTTFIPQNKKEGGPK